jgi:hypothetical protein
MPQTNSLAITTLPNGFEDDSNLRLSVVLTPSISTDDSTAVTVRGTPFDGWTGKLQQHPPSWTVNFTPVGGGASVPSPSVKPAADPDWRPDLWTAIFGAERHAINRKGNGYLQNSWRLSHNISDLHDRHRRLRYAHAMRTLNTNMAKGADSDSIQKLRGLHTGYNGDVECHTPPVLYLFPTLKVNDADATADASVQIDQRNAAIAARHQIDAATNVTPDQKETIQSRIDHALDLLEIQEGARLQGAALYCLYRHCVVSILPNGSGIESSLLNNLYKAFTDAARPLIPAACSNATDPVGAYQDYVEMLLFHRRKPDPKECTIAKPDFHQLLGMLSHYPAMLRPIGLAFDVNVRIPTTLSDGAYLVAATNVFPGATFGPMTVASYQTQCQFARTSKLFFTIARDTNAIDQRYLSLDAKAPDGGSAYNFSQEDADGSSLKFTDQANNGARASEYTSSAPTSMTTTPAAKRFGLYPIGPTPSGSAHPTDAPPAARTVGLALFHEDRLATLEGVMQKAPATTPTNGQPATPKDPGPLHAEDLMLGLRVDIKHGSRSWRSLCSRQSKYKVHFVDSPEKTPLEWNPRSGMELLADEGFVTTGATQSSLDDDTIQTQIHQSLFTWTGWSLAVPKPNGFKSVNPPTDCAGTGPLSIEAKYDLLPGSFLPALRFNDDYQVRCRVVDLAGNSVPCLDSDTPHATKVDPVFSRHEPVRAPQILLTEPIDRLASPGESVDHLVARDGDEPASRMLVPPRESLRLAELHGVITKKNPLPESAFTAQNLMPDGSFPSVQQAWKKGWIRDAIDQQDATHNQDAIFTTRKGAFEVINPFYPDPLAHYIRVKPFLVSDDPKYSRPLGNNFYIEIDPLDKWPNFLATIVDLNAKPDEKRPTVDLDNDDRPPSITVNLPQGYTVVLEISSAADSGDGKVRATDTSKSVALHQLHTSRMALLKNSSGRDRLVHDLMGTGLSTIQAIEAELKRIVVDIFGTKTAADVLSDPNSYINGDLSQVTPPRIITFVHAVRRPIEKPDFAPVGSAGDLKVHRLPGQANAAVSAGIAAHWLSTGKITCLANWQDRIDDPKADQPGPKQSHNVAFTVTAPDTLSPTVPDFDGTSYVRILRNGISQAFPDTRAHTVTYALSAATGFRAYYPLPPESKPSNPPAPSPDESSYSVPGLTKRTLTVLSSVRPPIPSVAYIMPAYCWRDTYEPKTRTWYSGRDVLLRAYFERPFLVSGDLEGIGIVIAAPALAADEKTQPFVSRWGADPIRPIAEPITSSALTERNLCQSDNPVQPCLLVEGGVANIKPYSVQFAHDRKLWFADIPMNTLGAFGPFVRLALVRWQPQALHGEDPNIDARISPVVFADFIQISPNRWVSVQRKNDSTYVVTVSGVFPPLENGADVKAPASPAITLTLYSRWYATGKDSGWRPVACKTKCDFTPAPIDPSHPADGKTSISSWTSVVTLPHSAAHRKYRILLQEKEWFSNSKISRVTYSQFVELP